jgi:hypothetical protein
MKPEITDHPDYYRRYIALVDCNDVVDGIRATTTQSLQFIRSLDEDRGNFAYAEGKWTVKEVLIHCMDTERIFSTRALCFARGEKQKSLSFDENTYAPNSHANLRSLADIAVEFESIGKSTEQLFTSFPEEVLKQKGETPSGWCTVNAIGFAICGHTLHHLSVIRDRYLK